MHLQSAVARLGFWPGGSGGLEAANQDVLARGGEALSIPVDLSDYRQVENASEQIENELGPITIWVNCAMTTLFAPLWDITPEEYRRVTEVTYLGFVYGTMPH